MGDDRSLSQQIQSVERSMVFLRQEHLTLLHGLHLEILSLQKRCTGEGRTSADPYRNRGEYCLTAAYRYSAL